MKIAMEDTVNVREIVKQVTILLNLPFQNNRSKRNFYEKKHFDFILKTEVFRIKLHTHMYFFHSV